jgi:hypothetical protein
MLRLHLCLGLALVLASEAALAADANSLNGIHWWGWNGSAVDSTPASMLQSQVQGAYDLEIVNTHDGFFWSADWFKPLFQDLYSSKNVTLVTRIDYQYGQTVPSPTNPDYAGWSGNVTGIMNVLRDSAHIWQLGNEPNLQGEASGWANNQITPTAYAQIYQNVHAAMVSNAVNAAPGAHKLLLAPPSPGDAVANVRWISGNDWLGQTIDAFGANKNLIDGIAIHGYGGGDAQQSFIGFRNSIANQVALIDSKGLSNVPIYITEFNRFTDPNNPSDEATTAQFVREAYKFLDTWNRTPGNHNIVAANWFVYDSDNQAGGGWNGYAVEYWKSHGYAAGDPNDLFTAFGQTAALNYAAGVAGTRPLPAGVQIIEDFESDNGRFTFTPTQSSFSKGASATSFHVATPDDSFTRSQGQKIGIFDDPANVDGWYVHYPSAGGVAGSNVAINLTSGDDGNIGFFLRVLTNSGASTGLAVQLLLDSGASGGGTNTDAGAWRDIIADGQWHYYEWAFDNAADWTAWRDASGNIVAGSDGLIASTGRVSLDSIVFRGGNQNVEYFLDGVMRNSSGSINVMVNLPEPTMLAALNLLMLTLARRRPGRARSQMITAV